MADNEVISGYISKVTLPSGYVYEIKDAAARSAIEALSGGDAIVFVGVSSVELTDGGTQTPKVNNTNVTPAAGQLFFYGTSEFIWGKDNKWHELGDLSSLGDLAYKDSASGNFTPSGTVSTPTFTGSSSNVTITSAASADGNYTPAGSITGGAFTGASMTSTGNFTPSGSITVSTKTTSNKTATVSTTTGDATYTPAGSITGGSFTGASMTSTGNFTPSGSVSFTNSNQTATVSKTTGTATYTPEGSVAAPTISVATEGTTTTIKNPTAATVATAVTAAAPGQIAPNNNLTYYNVTDETLQLYQIGYTTGSSISTQNVTVKTGDATYSASAPAFTGTGARLVTGNISVPSSASFSGTEGQVSVTGTTTGSVGSMTFTGTGVRLVTGNIPVPETYEGSFSGTQGSVSVTGTTTGSVGSMTFTGTKVQLSGTTTAAGSVSQPTFTGTQGTVTVS